jgi:hypothetical protein
MQSPLRHDRTEERAPSLAQLAGSTPSKVKVPAGMPVGLVVTAGDAEEHDLSVHGVLPAGRFASILPRCQSVTSRFPRGAHSGWQPHAGIPPG